MPKSPTPDAPVTPSPGDGERTHERAIGSLETEVASVVGAVNAGHARLVQLTARALSEGLWEQWGIHSPVQWLVWKAGLSPAHARQIVDVARRVDDLPHLDRAVQQGEVSVDQAAVVARRCPVGFDADVVAVAANATVPQLSRVLRRYQFDEPTADAGEPQPSWAEPEPDRRVTFGGTESGGWRATLELPADEGAVLEQALLAKRDELFRRDNPDLDPDSAEGRQAQRQLSWADAAVALAADSLTVGELDRPGTVSDRFRVLVHLEADPVDPAGPGVASLHLGAPLPDSLRRLLTCDGDLVPLWERHGSPVAVGRSQRIVPRRVRRLVEHRDGGCRVPGCGQTRWLHIHHIVHWEHLGRTDPDNMICLCPRHHRLHHLGHLPITGSAADLTICDQRGRPLEPVGAPRPLPSARPSEMADRLGAEPGDYRHPPGERIQPHWVDFAPNRDCRASTPVAAAAEREPASAGIGSRSP